MRQRSISTRSVSNQVVIDREAASIVYQVVDNRTSQVVRQFPEEAVLRRRAYFHTLDLTKDAPSACARPTARLGNTRKLTSLSISATRRRGRERSGRSPDR